MSQTRQATITAFVKPMQKEISTDQEIPFGTVCEVIPAKRPEPNELVWSMGNGTFARGQGGTRRRAYPKGSILRVVGIALPENGEPHAPR